jgi:hypothetical protein
MEAAIVSNLSGDLARCVTHEANDDWPTLLEIVAYFGKQGRKGKRRSILISADEFFGRNGHGAPISGEALIRKVEQLRRLA